MIVNFKFFHEKTIHEQEEYNKLWSENKNKMIILNIDTLFQIEQIKYIKDEMTNNKEILVIHYPLCSILKRNKIINDIMLGNGVCFDNNKIWFPKEVWILNTTS